MAISKDQLMQMNMEQAFWAGMPTLPQVERALDLWLMYAASLDDDITHFRPERSAAGCEATDTAMHSPTMAIALYISGCDTGHAPDGYRLLENHMPRQQSVLYGRNVLRLVIPQSVAYAKLVRRKLAANGHPMYANLLDTLEQLLEGSQPGCEHSRLFDDDNPMLHIRPSSILPRTTIYSYPPNAAADRFLEAVADMLHTTSSRVYNANYIAAKDVPMYSLRELFRIAYNEYIPLPDHIVENIDPKTMVKETPHLAIKGSNRGKIAYTENAKKGENDIQSLMKPGKYLRRVLKDSISDKELKEMVAELYGAATFEVKVTTDPEVAKQVYLKGPSSCMSKRSEQFDTEDDDGKWRHPIEALFDYDNDIALVYVMNGDRPCARALLNTDTMTYPSFYIADWSPNAKSILNDWLETEGYARHDEALEGQPIAKIEVGRGRLLCPYIDSGNLGVCFEYDHLIIGGPFRADYRNGWVSEEDPEDMRLCVECDETHHMDGMRLADWDDEWYCDGCYDSNFVLAITECGDDVMDMPYDRTIELPGYAAVCGCRLNRVHEDIDNCGLAQLGFIRLDSDNEIYDIDECVCTEDTSEWVHVDDVFGPNDEPDLVYEAFERRSYATNEEDGCVYDLNDMVWIVEEGVWCHKDGIDSDRIETARSSIRFLPPEAEDAQDVA